MTLPTQLRKQIDDANARMAQLTAAPEGAQSAEAGTVVDEQPVPETESASAPEGATPVEPVATPQQEDENSPTYAQRYRSLQGIFNSQKVRLDETLQRVGQLEQLITTMQTSQPQAARPAAPSTLTDKDTEEYGADMVDFTRRAARGELEPVLNVVKALQNQVAQLSQLAPQVRQVATNQHASAEDKFFTVLAANVADWEDINDSQKFSDWLDVQDPVFGLSRRVALNDARDRLDVARVVSLFNQFKGTGAPSAAAKARPNAAASQLERQVAPGRGSAATSAPVQRQAKTWSPSDISSFYRDKMQGKYKGKEAEAAALEKDIFLAQREGRVVQNAA